MLIKICDDGYSNVSENILKRKETEITYEYFFLTDEIIYAYLAFKISLYCLLLFSSCSHKYLYIHHEILQVIIGFNNKKVKQARGMLVVENMTATVSGIGVSCSNSGLASYIQFCPKSLDQGRNPSSFG